MANRDFVSGIKSQLALSATISTNTTTNGTDIDTAQQSEGTGFAVACTAFSAGSFAVNVQESDVGGGAGYTDVATANIIGTEPTITAVDSAGGTLAKVGVFGTKRYVRVQIVSTGASGSNTFAVVAQNVTNIQP